MIRDKQLWFFFNNFKQINEINMNINILKSLIVSYCLVFGLVTEVYGQDDRSDLERKESTITHQCLPTGSIVSFAGETPPDGWLLCDGGRYSNQRYPELYSVIDTKYVPNGSWIIEANGHSEIEKFFCVPDLRGRVIVGVDAGAGRITASNELGESGGEERHQLTIAELAGHTHTVIAYGGGPTPVDSLYPKSGSISPNQEVSSVSGGDQPHNNMQPYSVLNYIINTGKAWNRQNSENIEDLKIQLEAISIAHHDKLISFDTLDPDVNKAIYTLARCLVHIMHHNFGWRSNSICFYDEVQNIQITAQKYMNPKSGDS